MKGFLANCEIVAFSLTPDNSAVGFRIRNNCRGKKMKKKISVISCLSLWRLLYQSESRSVMSNSFRPHGLYSPWNSSRQITGVGSCSLLQGIFLTHGSNSGLPHCRRILYQLSHKGSTRILEWVTYPFSADLPNPGIKLGSPALQADSLLTELSRKSQGIINWVTYEQQILTSGSWGGWKSKIKAPADSVTGESPLPDS